MGGSTGNCFMNVSMVQHVLLLEDHPDAQVWLSQALYLAFGESVHIDVTALLEDAKIFEQKRNYDLVIADLHVPDGSGIELIQQVKTLHPARYCVVATIFSDKAHLFPALRVGADGYLMKDESQQSIADMLQGILQGKPPVSPAVMQQMLQYFHAEHPTGKKVKLTEREREVLMYISKGMSTKACAELMSISHNTASEYIRNVYQKLGVHSRAEATIEAIHMGII